MKSEFAYKMLLKVILSASSETSPARSVYPHTFCTKIVQTTQTEDFYNSFKYKSINVLCTEIHENSEITRSRVVHKNQRHSGRK